MKKALYIIGIALAIAGCTKSEITENTPASGEISFSAGVTTRVGSGDDDCTWASSGDVIGIFTDQPSDTQNLKFSVTTGGAMTNESGTTLTTLASGARTYYAYHPYSDAQNAISIIEIDITPNSVPLLYAKETTNDSNVTLKFNHVLAKVSFNLTAGGVDVTTMEHATARITGAYTKSKFDLTTGEFASTYSETINLTINNDNTIGPLYLIPSTTAAKLWIKAGGNTFVKSLDEWKSGEEYEYDITVGETNND